MNKLTTWYNKQINDKLIVTDNAQLQIISLFDKFIHAFEYWQKNFLTRILSPIDNSYKNGFYIYGEVGRGKSMLISALYDNLSSNAKLRIHFHQFMQNIQQLLSELKHLDNPLNLVAKKLASQYKIIFLDEMHVSDIATAMILKNLLLSLFKHKIFLVISSNFAPSELYQDGLMRSRFIPAINVLNQQLNVIEIIGNNDYRFKNEAANHLFQINNLHAHTKLEIIFANISNGNNITQSGYLEVQHRQLRCIKASRNIIWFNFTVICGDGRSQLDYIELASRFDWFIIEGIFKLTHQNQDLSRRFTLLIDILYDSNKKIALSCSCPISQLYTEGEFNNEFARTISRLQEMQTQEYLAKPSSNSIVET
jgi:cell division protein ZapE